MPRKKRYRSLMVKDLVNVLECPFVHKGTWRKVFHNDNDIVLELGCGRGEVALGLAELFPTRNIIGIDKKSDRLWFGGKGIEELHLTNVRFLRLPIERITECFAPFEVNEIWITFPDPFLRRRDAKKRLISPRFLDLYRQILKPNAIIHLKTDSQEYFEYVWTLLGEQHIQPQKIVKDIYQQDISSIDPVLLIQTCYEKRHLANRKKIYYVSFKI